MSYPRFPCVVDIDDNAHIYHIVRGAIVPDPYPIQFALHRACVSGLPSPTMIFLILVVLLVSFLRGFSCLPEALSGFFLACLALLAFLFCDAWLLLLASGFLLAVGLGTHLEPGVSSLVA